MNLDLTSSSSRTHEHKPRKSNTTQYIMNKIPTNSNKPSSIPQAYQQQQTQTKKRKSRLNLLSFLFSLAQPKKPNPKFKLNPNPPSHSSSPPLF